MLRWFMLTVLILVASPAFAASIFNGVENRSQAIYADLKGNNSYHAHLARKLAAHAVEEKRQSDIGVARQLMDMAEEHARKAGGQ